MKSKYAFKTKMGEQFSNLGIGWAILSMIAKADG